MPTDFYTATDSDLAALGWRRWSDDSQLRLCPADQFANLPRGIALWSISGTVHVKGRDYIDDDTRGGMLAYGIIPGQTRTDVTAEQVAAKSAQDRAAFASSILEAVAECGVFDLATGRMLHGEEAQAAMRQTLGVPGE